MDSRMHACMRHVPHPLHHPPPHPIGGALRVGLLDGFADAPQVALKVQRPLVEVAGGEADDAHGVARRTGRR